MLTLRSVYRQLTLLVRAVTGSYLCYIVFDMFACLWCGSVCSVV